MNAITSIDTPAILNGSRNLQQNLFASNYVLCKPVKSDQRVYSLKKD